jgi:hypothetical protein
LRLIYTKSSLRLGAIFIVTSLLYLPIAIIRPDFLLVFGPLIYGYFHLVASYYFVQPTQGIKECDLQSRKKFKIFTVMTFISIILLAYINKQKVLLELPYGSLELMAATGIFIYIVLSTRLVTKKFIYIIILLNIIMIRTAWFNPLTFVSATLFLHNWIAFIYWIIIAKDRDNRRTAIMATLSFAIIHVIVILGYFDNIIIQIQSHSSILAANIDATTWLLTPWSNEFIVGKRALVLYTFGLSIHYFIWLKAIPENRQKNEIPYSYKRGFKKFKEDVGSKMTLFLTALIAAGISTWLYSFTLGAAIYFVIASIHTWLELVFLVPRLFMKETNLVNNC